MEHRVDVSDLEPPEPLERVLEAVERLARGDFVRMLHRREPMLLYPILAERDFAWSTRRGTRSEFEVLIWRSGDAAAERAARAAGP